MGELKVNKHFAALLTCAALILFSFQNCGRSGFTAQDEATLLSTSLTGTNAAGGASGMIAYDVGLDSITYNSCIPSVNGISSYYTLNATASGTRGGARLTSDFMTSAASTLKPVVGNSVVEDVQYKELIEQINPGLELQVALRSATDLRAAYNGTSSGGIWGSFTALTDDAWMTPVVSSARTANNAWVGYTARAPASTARMGFSFSQDFSASDYWSNTLSAQSFRACTSQGCQGFGTFNIAVGFSEDANRSLIRSPVAYTSVQTKAYGRGYQLQYGYAGNNPSVGMRVLNGIVEYNLATNTQIPEGNAIPTWSCTQIPIMSSAQRGPSNAIQTSAVDGRYTTATPASYYLCNPMSGALANSISPTLLAKIRELLPPNQWQLGYQNYNGASRLCVVPTGFDCYPQNETFPNYNATTGVSTPYPYYVEYDTTKTCINEDNMSSLITGGAINSVCAHYVTICTKQ
jgi:hypothetical protein